MSSPKHEASSPTKVGEISPSQLSEFGVTEQEVNKHLQIENDLFEIHLSDESRDLKAQKLADIHGINPRKLTLKKDIFVVLPLFILYLLANLNRSHTGILWILGIKYTLKMDDMRASAAVSAFYVPYVAGQLFSNFVLKKIRPHFYISICTFIYGTIVFSTGFVQSYGAYIGCEFLHGLFQSGCDCAIFYVLSSYYERRNVQKRVSFIYSTNSLAMFINIVAGKSIRYHLPDPSESWRWMLKIEGPITMFLAIFLFFFTPDFPEGNRFLTDNETLYIVKELEIYQGKSGYNIPITIKDIFRGLNCPLVICTGFITHCFGSCSIGLNLLAPLGFSLDYTTGGTLLEYSWLISFFVVNVFGWISDFTQQRFATLMAACCMMLAGLIGFLCVSVYSGGMIEYNLTIVSLNGIYSAYALFVGWSTFNLNGHLRRSVVITVLIAFCDASGIYAPFAAAEDFIVGISFASGAVAFIIVYLGVLIYKNHEKRTFQYAQKFAALSQRRQILEGDRRPGFRYQY